MQLISYHCFTKGSVLESEVFMRVLWFLLLIF
jgi:hypothetical protein